MASRSPAVDVLADLVGWTGQPRWMPDWSITERLLGLTLPDDYKVLLSTIPVGRYAGTVLVQPPTSRGRVGDLLAMFTEPMKFLAELRNKPYPVYPDLPGLIPWALFSGPISGELYWLADRGDPNKWPVVASGADGNWEEFDVGAVAFLIALVRGKIPSGMVTPQPDEPAYQTYQDIPGGPSNTGR